MQDRVADVLAQRAALDRGAGAGIALSVLLHGGLAGLAIYTALHSPPPRPATMVNIQFANVPAPAAPRPAQATPAAQAPAAPKIEEPKPVIAEPKPEPPKETPPQKPQKNTVPLSPFGQSTRKGSEQAPPPAPPPAAPAAATSTAPEVPVGGSGVTGIEGGDFPHTLYLQGMQRKIGGNWYRPASVAPGTTTVVYFRIQRDGTITGVEVMTRSGNATFDRAARSAVVSSSPLNPLPFAYQGTYLGVHLTFR